MSTIRINTRLIRVFYFPRIFNLDIKYKTYKENIILDVLSRLSSLNLDSSLLPNIYSKLDTLFTTAIVEII